MCYSLRSKDYICYNKRLKRIVESANVKVDETIQYTTIPEVEDEEESILTNIENTKEVVPKTPTKYVQKITLSIKS